MLGSGLAVHEGEVHENDTYFPFRRNAFFLHSVLPRGTGHFGFLAHNSPRAFRRCGACLLANTLPILKPEPYPIVKCLLRIHRFLSHC